MKDSLLTQKVEELRELRNREKRLKSKIDKLQAAICAEFESRDAQGLVLGEWRVTYVQAERVEYLIPRFKKMLSGSLFKRITKPIVDKDKLEEAVLAGDIDMDVVSECTEIKKNKPFVKITEAKAP